MATTGGGWRQTTTANAFPKPNAIPESGTPFAQSLLMLADPDGTRLDPEDPWGLRTLPPDQLARIFGGGGGGTGGGTGGGGVALAAAPPAPVLDPMSNPEYLRTLAGIDAAEATAIGGIRTRQDAARRSLTDLLGDIGDREVKSGVRTKETQEQRGLLRSGATERLLADVAEAAGSERARGESSTAEQIGQLEQAVAEAKIAAEKERGAARLSATGLA